MFTAAWDEPFALPSEDSATLAMRTQQVLASETGVARVADPLGGSYYVEALTDEVEARVIEVMDDLERRGGMVKAVEDGYLHSLIAEEAFRVQQAMTSGERVRALMHLARRRMETSIECEDMLDVRAG